MTVEVRPLSKLVNRVFKNHPASLEHDLIYLVDMIGSQYQDKWMAKIQNDDQLWDAIRSYLARGADINAQGDLGKTVLNALCEKDHPGTVAKMLAEGADPNIADSYLGFTPLMMAAMEANYPLMKVLVDGGADVKAQTTDRQNSVLWFLLGNAEYKSRDNPQVGRDCLQLLLDHGITLNDADKKVIFKNSPSLASVVPDLQRALNVNNAAEKDDPAALKELLNSGVHPDAAAAFGGDTALQIAIAKTRDANVDALLEAGADVNLRSPVTLRTPLQEAAQAGNRTAFAKLVGKGADVHASDGETLPPDLLKLAHDSSTAGMEDFVRQTLEAHASGQYATDVDHSVAVHHSLHLQLKNAGMKP